MERFSRSKVGLFHTTWIFDLMETEAWFCSTTLPIAFGRGKGQDKKV